jgi:4-amino-4-deoxy-L-arabinose transferase-like glycosyltransferase
MSRSCGRRTVAAIALRPTLASTKRSLTAAWPLVPLLPIYVLVWALLNPGSSPVGDEGPLLGAARRITEGGYADTSAMNGTKFLWHGPGLPALLSPLVALRVPLTDMRLLGPLLLFAAILAFYRLLRLRLSRRAALVATYALGLYAPTYQTLPSLHKEPLALLLVIVAMDAGTRYARYGRRQHLTVAALALGWLVMTRLEYGWVLTALAVATTIWWLRERRVHPGEAQGTGRWALVAVAGFVACIPWLAYTYDLTGHIFYWGNSGGLSLYWMAQYGRGQLGQWHAVHTVFRDPRLASYRPFFRHLRALHPLQADLALRHAAVKAALARPYAYLVNVLANVGRIFFGLPFSFTLPIGALVGLIAFNGTLLAAVGAAVVRVVRARQSLPPEAVPFLLFAAIAFALHLLTSAEPRMLIPVVPALIWLVAHGLSRSARTDHAPGSLALAGA